MAKTEKTQIKELEQKVKKLEAFIQTQKQLIDVLKTIPSNKGVKIKDGKRVEKKSKVSKGAHDKSGRLASDVTKGQSENSIGDVTSESQDAKGMEESAEKSK